MKCDIDSMLKQALSPEDQPAEKLKHNIMKQIKETEQMTNIKKRRISTVVLAAALVLSLCSVTAFAAWKYLSPAEVANHGEQRSIAKAFEGGDAIAVNETQNFGGYKVTFLGAVSGKNINEYVDKERAKDIGDGNTYTVVAIERNDGKTIDSAEGAQSFFVSPLIQGLNPGQYNIASMGGGYTEFTEDGVLYRLAQCDNVEMFADKNLYLCVNTGAFYDQSGYKYNQKSGEITRNKSYTGVNALFSLPMDPKKADSKAAEAYLEKLKASWEDQGEEIAETEVDMWMKKLTPENLSKYAQVVKETTATIKPDKDGILQYSYEYEGGSGSGAVQMSVLFPTGETGISPQFSYSYNERGMEGLSIQTFTKNEDGSVTFALYVPK